MSRNHATTALAIFAVATSGFVGLTRLDEPADEPITPVIDAADVSAAGARGPATRSAATAPAITYVDEPTTEQREMVDWAIERYLDVGLQLPDLEISFPVFCDGKAGRYFVGQGRVELCRPKRKLVLHELAHAWDDSTEVDREAFLELRGVDHWYERRDDECEQVSGGEQLAQVVTWGLMHVDLTAPSSDYAGQPLDEQPRSLPGLDDSSPETLTDLFVMLTGADPLTPGRVMAADEFAAPATSGFTRVDDR